MHTHHRLVAASGIVLVALLAPAPAPATAAAPAPSYTWSRTPSPIVLRPPSRDMYFRPVIFCWTAPSDDPNTSSMVCGDGFPPPDAQLRTARTQQALRMWFGMPRWRFTASMVRLRTVHARTLHPRVSALSARTFRIARPARAGSYRVVLSGQGPQGDETIWFRWRVLRR
ncbi:MAG TPA: hypothetical protein VJ872_04755 [Nocardioides sp.]|nr:hypothetical protein [Nocardioides sp.]